MKKLIIILISMMSLPVFASCPIDGGACTASSNWEATPLQQKYVPDRLQDLQRTDSFQPTYITPYHDALINTDTGTAQNTNENNYNSNCQFGVCLPGVEPGGEIIE